MGVRLGQDPFDALVIQEMLFDVKPDLIIETGTNSGGAALYMAVLMEAINPACRIFTIDTVPIDEWMTKFKNPQQTSPYGRPGSGGGNAAPSAAGRALLGSDDDTSDLVDPRENPFWRKRVTQAVGKSTDRRILKQLRRDFLPTAKKVLVVLDSDHSSGTVSAPRRRQRRPR